MSTNGNGNGNLTADQIIAALKEANGYLSQAAGILKCSRQTIYNRIRDYPTIGRALDEIREARTDYVENQLMKLIKAENVTAIIFYLKCQAKDRGYVERQEVTGASGEALLIKLDR